MACVDFFFSEWNLLEECTRKRERMWTRGRVLGAEWNGWDNCTALKTPTKYPPPKSYTSPSPVAPSHSNYEPRAGRSEYNFLYCVNVRTYVWIRKMFILQKKKKKYSLRTFIQLHSIVLSNTNSLSKLQQMLKTQLRNLLRTLTCC